MMLSTNSKNVFVAVVGAPNAGKSTLINSLVGQKVSIVSPKPQTTRTKILGILTKNQTQFVFIDTPGIHTPKTQLGKYMQKAINSSVSSVDVAILVSDITKKIKQDEINLLEKLNKSGMPTLLVLNKIDLVKDKSTILKHIQNFSNLHKFNSIIPLSALKKDGIDVLLDELVQFATFGAHFFDDDLTDQPEKVLVAEIIREKMLQLLDQEIPHGTAVAVKSMKNRQNAHFFDINVTIFCDKENHKKIIIGKNGAMLKKIGSLARQDIEALLDAKINLKIWLKVKENWKNNTILMKNFGYDFKNFN